MTQPTTSFEAACLAAKVSLEEVESLGLDAAFAKAMGRLAETGWTTEMLCDEARRRMHTRLEEK